jgi:hypothetical protein
VGTRLSNVPGIRLSLHDQKFPKIRELLIREGFTELPAKSRGRVTFQRREQFRDGSTRTYEIHFDPNDASGTHWHKYVVDEHGQHWQLNDRGYVDAEGTNNPIPRVHIPGRR